MELQQASLGYRGHSVLENLDLKIAAGDFVVIGGPNGGGKSTLLKTISGLIPLLKGTRNVNGMKFGYVPQQAASEVPLPITAFEVVELGASALLPLHRTFFRMERAFYLDCLRECQADTFAKRNFSELSGGQRQRVLLARSLAVRPNALLLDEPTAGVDQATQLVIARLLARLNREQRMTVALVTHEFEPFRGIATHFLRVADGGAKFLDIATFTAGSALHPHVGS
jgi:ABC-type Mn2+/Zn2+ transport system ATPase subunit